MERKKAEKAAARLAGMTFGKFADSYVEAHKAGWSNSKHAAQWSMTLGPNYCKPIRSKPIAEIVVQDVLEVLTPVWQSKPETARRVRMRSRRCSMRLGSKASGPVKTRPLEGAPRSPASKAWQVDQSHHAAMPWAEVPDFLRQLEQREGTAALAFRFLILTAGRTSEVLKARWDEIDSDKAIWTVPAVRMKQSASTVFHFRKLPSQFSNRPGASMRICIPRAQR